MIEDGCVLEYCIVGSDAKLLHNTTVSRGCILDYGLIVGPDVTLPSFSGISNTPNIVENVLGTSFGSESTRKLCAVDSDDGSWRILMVDDSGTVCTALGRLGYVPSPVENECLQSEVESESGSDGIDGKINYDCRLGN